MRLVGQLLNGLDGMMGTMHVITTLEDMICNYVVSSLGLYWLQSQS